MPPTALVSARVNEVGASLNANVTVPVPLATFTSVLLIDTATVGVTVSTVKAAVLPPAPALPLPSCQVPAVTLTDAVLMSVLAAPGEGRGVMGAVGLVQVAQRAAHRGGVGECVKSTGASLKANVTRPGAVGDVDVGVVDRHRHRRRHGIDREGPVLPAVPASKVNSETTEFPLSNVPAHHLEVPRF